MFFVMNDKRRITVKVDKKDFARYQRAVARKKSTIAEEIRKHVRKVGDGKDS